MNKYIIIRTTFSKIQNARNLAEKLLQKKLCACVQISKIESFYLWDNKTQNDDEFLLEIKTKRHLLEDIKSLIIVNHEYETAQIISFEFNAHGKYKTWLDKNII